MAAREGSEPPIRGFSAEERRRKSLFINHLHRLPSPKPGSFRHNPGTPKKMPSLRSDAAAERLVATSDLTKYDLSGFKPMRFEIEPKSAASNMRLPRSLLDAVKAETRARGIRFRVNRASHYEYIGL